MVRRWLTPRGWALAGVTGVSLAALAAPAILDPAPRLVWNASASAPIGLWRIDPRAVVKVADTVIAEPPPAARRLAAQRHYLPANVPMIKAVAAGPGDTVCAFDEQISVNGRPVARRRASDRRGRSLPWWRGCQRLTDGAVFLLNPSPDSFDGRYFGPVQKGAIIGKATLLWAR